MASLECPLKLLCTRGFSIVEPIELNQFRIERSFELDILLKNFRMKQKTVTLKTCISTSIILGCTILLFVKEISTASQPKHIATTHLRVVSNYDL